MNIPCNSRSAENGISLANCSLLSIFCTLILMVLLPLGSANAQVQNLCGDELVLGQNCGEGVSVYVFGDGAHDQIETTVSIPIDVSFIDSMFVEVMMKGPLEDVFLPIEVATVNDTCIVLPSAIENVGSDEKAAAYRCMVNGASEVKVTVDPSNFSDIQSVTVFVVSSGLACDASAVLEQGILLLHACDTVTLAPVLDPMDLYDVHFQIPISELGDGIGGIDDRPAEITIEFWEGGAVADFFIDTITGPDNNISDYLTIYDTTVVDVPGTTDSIRVLFRSPGVPGVDPFACGTIGDGDSFIVGTMIVQAECPSGSCCIIDCMPPDTVFELCQFNIPPVPANLLDSIGPLNMMGQNIDSIAFVDTVMGTLNQVLCNYFIILDSTVNELVFIDGTQNLCRTRYYAIYQDSAGTYVYDTTCIQVICATLTGDITMTCPPDDTALCDISEIPPYADLYEFLDGGGMIEVLDYELDTSSFTLVDETSDNASCPETITRTYQIMDSCGNVGTCMQMITVNDTIPPQMTCPGVSTFECITDVPAAYATLDEFIVAGGTVSDNCGLDSATFMLAGEMSSGMMCPDTIIRIYTVMDSCGNLAMCGDTIIVDDTIDPVITCPPDATVECSPDEIPIPTTYAEFIAAGGSASDNCGIVESSFSFVIQSPGIGSCPTVYQRYFGILDSCQNLHVCIQLITVNDTTPPTLLCPTAPGIAECDASEVTPFATLDELIAGGGSAMDNCILDTLSFTLLGEASDGLTCPETVTRTYQIADSCGNTATCQHIIIVDDNTPPTLTCPDPAMVVCDISEWTPYADYDAFLAAGGSADDNCGIVEESFSLVDILPTVDMCPQNVLYTYTIEDSCGNIGFCVHLVIVNDTIPPTIDCPSDTIVECTADLPSEYTNLDAFLADGGTVDDNCAIDSSTFMLLSRQSDGLMCPETITSTYQIADSCGNTATCVHTIMIDDMTAPELTCPDTIFVGCITAVPAPYGTFAEFIAAGGTGADNCGLLELSFTFVDQVSDGMMCPETITRTYAISDSCDNIGMCQQVIVVNDETPPILLCPVIPPDIQCDASEFPAATNLDEFFMQGGTVADNCALDSASFSLVSEMSDNMMCPETITRTYSIMDSCGNVGTCISQVVVFDFTPPQLTCPDPDTVLCDISEAPAFDAYADFVAAGGNATDNCSINEESFTLVDESFSGFCPIVYVRTYSIMDSCGNEATCDHIVFVDDTIPPAITCPPGQTAICDISEVPAYNDLDEFLAAGGTAMDDCGLDSNSLALLSETSDGMTCPETVTRTYSVADSCGNVATCVQRVVIDDDIPPMITCPEPDTTLCDAMDIPPFADYMAFTASGGSASDNCEIDEMSFTLVDEMSDGMIPETVTRTYEISDLCGNTATCDHIIIVIDTVPPMFDCPDVDMDAICDASEIPIYTSQDLDTFIMNGGIVGDNCLLDSLSLTLVSEESDGNMCPETVVRTYLIADVSGNTATCQQIISVNDMILPMITCPETDTVQCIEDLAAPYADLDAFLADGGSASDNCALDSASFTLSTEVQSGICPTIVTRRYSIMDSCGNEAFCSHIIIVIDTIPPTIDCPNDTMLICSIDELPEFTSFREFLMGGGTFDDNCAIDSNSFALADQQSDGMTCPQTITRTYSIADSCGNVATCVQTITIDDQEPPMVTCPDTLYVQCGPPPVFQTYTAFFAAGGNATDNCGLVEQSFTLVDEVSDGQMCPETIIRTYSIEDTCGNVGQCEMVIVVNDTIPPALFCPVIPGNAECDASEVPPFANYADFVASGGSSFDNCGVDSSTFMLINEVSDGMMCPETVTRTYQIADSCGNIGTCSHLIIVNDQTPPTLTCPDTLYAVCDISEVPPFADYDEFVAAGGNADDNCGVDPATFTLISTISDLMCPEIVIRTYQIADSCGNLGFCEHVTLVNDTIPPMIACPPEITVECTGVATPVPPPFGGAQEFLDAGGTFSDNCGIDSLSLVVIDEELNFGDCFSLLTRTYQVADSCGNTATCYSSIRIVDTTPPTLTCPPDIEAQCATDDIPPYATVEDFIAAGGVISDICGLDTTLFGLVDEVSDGMMCPETITRTYVAIDFCGNVSMCTQRIIINDTVPPALDCNLPSMAVCSIAEIPVYTEIDSFIAAGGDFLDNCAIDSSSFSFLGETTDGNVCPETITRTYSIADSCGNATTCVQIIVVDDNEPPMITCPEPDTAVCDVNEVPPFADYDEFVMAGGNAFDNCGIDESTFTLLDEVFTGMCPAVYLRTYSIMDSCGNEATCQHTVFVDDTIPPVIVCLPDSVNIGDICEIMVDPYMSVDEFVAAGGMISDNCGIDSMSFTVLPSSGIDFCGQMVTFMYIISDLCGNMDTCSQSFTVEDTVPPAFACPADTMIECSIGSYSAFADLDEFLMAGGTVSDGCEVDSMSFTLISEESDGMTCPETITRTYRIADVCGNTASCSQVITVDDDEAPTLTCPDELFFSCMVEEAPYATFDAFLQAGGNGSDNCGLDPATFTLVSETSDGMMCPETITRTYSVADSCGNTATCQQLVIVNDTIPPALDCNLPSMAVCEASEIPIYTDIDSFIAAGADFLDNCAIDSSSFTFLGETSDGNTCPETVTRTYSIADSCGNATTCVQIIVVEDLVPPTLTCPPDEFFAGDTCDFPIVPFASYEEFMMAGGSAMDNCEIDTASFTVLLLTSSISPCGQSTTITYSVSDLCGNTATCQQGMTVVDTVPPMFSCPPDTMAECSASDIAPYADLDAFLADGGMVSDGCEVDSMSFTLLSETSDGMLCPETVTRTYQVADICGNTSTCQQLITVNDTTPPALTCPETIVVECIEDVPPAYGSYDEFASDGGSASDNCALDITSLTLVSEVSDGMMCPETITRTYSIADSCGNTATCQQLVMVNDTTPPSLLCPTAPALAECDASEVAPFATLDEMLMMGGQVGDNCSIDTLSFSFLGEESDGLTCPETVTRTYQIADSCGNTATCQHIIIVDDNTPPTLTCPAADTVVCDISEWTPFADYDAFVAAGGSADDNCGIVEESFSLVDILPTVDICPQFWLYTYTIEDSCGNIGFCVHTVVVNDTVPPTIACAPDTTVECDISEVPSFLSYREFLMGGGTFDDNCSIDSMTFTLISEESDGLMCPETITRTYQIADSCGNTATCQQLIMVNDTTPPSLTCPETIVVECIEDVPTAYANLDEFTADGGSADDNCALDVMSFTLVSEESDGLMCPETITRTYTIADSCGNTATCQQLVMVNDTTPPSLLCPTAPGIAECDASEVAPFATLDEMLMMGGQVGDNCSIDTLSFSFLGEESDGLTCPETVTRTYQIADSCGNTATCQHIIIVDDNTPPTLTCPAADTVVCDISEWTPFADYDAFVAAGGSADDNCGIVEESFSLVDILPTVDICPQFWLYTYTIEDSCGNIGFCVHTVVVNDTVPPTITCAPDTSVECDISEVPSFLSYREFLMGGGTFDDNCSIDSMTFTLISEESDGMICPMTITRTYQIADSCGNTATCQQLIMVNDTTPPTITCPEAIMVECIEDVPPAYGSYDEFASDGGNADDNCALDITTLTLVSEESDGLTCPETITRTYQIADSCGNTATCQQLVMVNDTTPPSIACPMPEMAVCDASEVVPFATLDEFLMAGGTVGDNCSIDSMSFSLIGELGDGSTCPETVARTYQIADSCGNVATCLHIIIVDDDVPPTLTCPDADTVVCDISEWTPYANYDEFVAAGGSADDNCGIVEGSFSLVDILPTVDICPQTVLYTYTIEDSCGNIGFCVHTVIVNDTVPPTITCAPDTSVECDISEIPGFLSYREFLMGGGTFDDNCSIDSMTFTLISEESDGMMCPETITRTYQIADSCGNTATCQQLIMVNDTTPPMISCPEMLVIECIEAIPPFMTFDEFMAEGGDASDNCALDESSFTLISQTNNGQFCPLIVTRTYQIADSCGNTATCQRMIMVNDTTPPALDCNLPSEAVCSVDELPIYTDIDSFIADGGAVFDNCGIDSTSLTLISEVSDDMTCPETVTRTYQIADFCGNTNTCVQIIVVDDDIPPTLTCPAADTAVCSIDEVPPFASLDEFVAEGGVADDNCGLDSMSFTLVDEVMTGSCPQVVLRMYVVSDLCGNMASCQHTVIVDDTIPPMIDCPPADTALCSSDEVPPFASIDDFLMAGGTVSDNCGLDSMTVTLIDEVSDGNMCPEMVTRTYIVSDLCGNMMTCTHKIIVNDTVPPMLGFEPDMGGLTSGEPIMLGATIPPETVCSIDEVPPFADLDEYLNAGGTAEDNCGLDSASFTLMMEVSIADGMCPDTVSRTYKIADLCGNTMSCTQYIFLDDTEPPSISCPTDLDLDCTDTESPITTVDEFLAAGGSFSDNCGIDTASFTIADFSVVTGCPITITLTYQIADNCGNESSCSTTVEIDDTTPPTLTCPGDTLVMCIEDVPDAYASLDDFLADGGGAMDDCALDSASFMLVSETNDQASCPGTITRVYSITDVCGNPATCQQIITVNDTVPPMALCMDITLMFEDEAPITILPEDIDAGSTDNCGEITLELSDSTFSCLDFVDGVMAVEVTLTVTDECGNTSTCTATVFGEGSIIDIICPDDVCIWLDPGQCEAIYNYEVIAEAICGDEPSLIQIDETGYTSGDYFPIGITEQTWVAYNSMGDSAFCTFYVEVKEYPESSIPVCNDDINVSVDQNCEAWIGADMILEGGPYGCYDDYIIIIEGVGEGQGGVMIGSNEVGGWFTVTVTDPETGISCWSTIHVEDKFAPMLTCIDVTIPCTESTDPIYTDPVIGTFSQTEFPEAPIGPNAGTETTQMFDVVAPAGALVTDVNVLVDLTHTFSGDLEVELIAPDGVTTVPLAFDLCGAVDDWDNVIFDDEASESVEDACNPTPPALTGTLQPQGLLSDFDGFDPNGTWTLLITDDAGGDAGTLHAAGIEVEYFLAAPYAPIVHEACGEAELEYEDNVSGDDCSGIVIERTWTATDPSGNSATCVQTIIVEPLDLENLEMPEAYVGECGGSTDPSVTGWPTVDGIPISNGNICNIYATWEDKILPDCGGGTKILRKWLILDWCTQEVEKDEQVVKLIDNLGPEMTCPPDQTVGSDPWNCNADVVLIAPAVNDACGTPYTLVPSASAGTIVPFGNGNYRVDDIPYGETVITWTAEDACGNSSSCSYTITVIDDVPPVPLCDEHTVVSLTQDLVEHGLTKVPAEVFDDGSYDNCGDVTFTARRMDSCIDFEWTTGGACVDDIPDNTPNIIEAADKGTTFRPCVPFVCCDVATRDADGNCIPADPVMVVLRVEDEAGNVNECMVEVEVQDKLAPAITAPPHITVSCDFWFDVAETNGFVSLDQDVTVPVFGGVLDAYEYDEADRRDIIIDDPGNDQLPQPYNWGKEGWADDNCDVDLTVWVRIYDDCSGDDLPNPSLAPKPPHAVRLIRRDFAAEDCSGNSESATQYVWVVDFDPFYISDVDCSNQDRNDGVIWPCDEEYDNCPQGGIDPTPPVIFDDNCSLIGVTFEDEQFDFVDGACYKILRHWTVIDWCQYDALEQTGIWTYTQVIKVIDSEPTEIADCYDAPITRSVLDAGVELPDNNQVFLGEENPLASSCSVHVKDTLDLYEFCSNEVTYDVKIYPNNGSQFLQIHNKSTIEVDTNGFAQAILDTRTSNLLSVRLNGLPYNEKYCNPVIGGDKDYHRVLWTIEDGCGNVSTCEYLMRLEDRKAPSPVCVNLSSVVMPSSGEVTIWAADFNASSFDDCTPADDLAYSFSGQTYEPSRSFTCQDIEENGGFQFIVEIWAADEGNDMDCNGIITWDERNKDHCNTFILIADNEGVCEDAMAGGVIETEELETVESVEVHLMDQSGSIMDTYITGEDGTYQFLNPLLSYTIEPKKDGDDLNGVSTLDLVRIQKHLLGIEPFASPYKIIAADANNSESVTALDLVELRKLLLGITLELPNNTSWRFVDTDFEFADPNNPWPFDEIIELESGLNMHEDFMAIKVGDVNGTVVANATQIETRSAPYALRLIAQDQEVAAGEEVTVEVRSDEFADVLGYQFTMETEGLALASVDAGAIDMQDANVGVHRNAVTTSWHRIEPTSASADEVLFTLTFTAQKAGLLSEMLSISSRITEAEAYVEGASDVTILDVELTFEDVPAVQYGPDFALFQNEPNPFHDVTTIGFNLPEAMDAKLTVFDVTGRILKTIEGEYEAGYNEVQLQQRELQTTGVLYYRLDAGDVSATGSAQFSASKKMIIVE